MYIVKIYASLVKNGVKLIEDIPSEFRQLVADYLAANFSTESE